MRRSVESRSGHRRLVAGARSSSPRIEHEWPFRVVLDDLVVELLWVRPALECLEHSERAARKIAAKRLPFGVLALGSGVESRLFRDAWLELEPFVRRGRPRHVDPTDIRERELFADALRLVGSKTFENGVPVEHVGGLRRRVVFAVEDAVAFVVDPAVTAPVREQPPCSDIEQRVAPELIQRVPGGRLRDVDASRCQVFEVRPQRCASVVVVLLARDRNEEIDVSGVASERDDPPRHLHSSTRGTAYAPMLLLVPFDAGDECVDVVHFTNSCIAFHARSSSRYALCDSGNGRPLEISRSSTPLNSLAPT